MNNNPYKRLWLITRIWLIAVAVNTILGTVYLSGFAPHYETARVYLGLGVIWSGIFSTPIMIILSFTLKHCIDSNMTGWSLIRYILVIGIILTIFMFLIFCAVLSVGMFSILFVLLVIAVLSGIIGIVSQYRSLLRFGSDYQTQKV